MKAQTICRRLLVLSLVLIVGCEAPLSTKKNYELVWSDEFNGTDVDLSRWTFETGSGGWGNNELQYYRTENAAVADLPGEAGRGLVITAKKESFGGSAYTSSRLKTQGKASWTYGRIEARLKLPEGQGIWPAFWMLGESISSVGWPKCSEIDIMEMVGGAGAKDTTTYGTGHWYENGAVHQGGSLDLGTKLSAAFHVYAVEWTPASLTWSVDGKAFYSLPITAAARSEFHGPSFLLLNLAVGGNWPGSPDGTTVFPQAYWIDWIRVYQSR